MNELKAGRLAVTYAGCFLGAGFVSGQELWQFFGVFGVKGYMGFALSAVLFFLLGVLLVRLTQLSGINEMDTIEGALGEGFELVAMARALLREPDLPNRFRDEGRRSSLCVHCNLCLPTIYTGTRCVLVPEQ